MNNFQTKKEVISANNSLSVNDSKINSNNSKNKKFDNDKTSLESENIKNSKNCKRVTFSDKVDIINVVSWKKYNYEQTAEENFEGYVEEIENNKNNDDNNNNTKKRNKDKSENTTCTCCII